MAYEDRNKPEPTTHYTAVIEIVKVTTLATQPAENRDKQEVSRIVIRADTIEKLVTKAGAHLALVEE